MPGPYGFQTEGMAGFLGRALPGFGAALMQWDGDKKARRRQGEMDQRALVFRAEDQARDDAMRQEDLAYRAQQDAEDTRRYNEGQVTEANRFAATQKNNAVERKDRIAADERGYQRQEQLARLQAALRPAAGSRTAGDAPAVRTPAVGTATEGERKGNMALGRARDAAAILDSLDEDRGARMVNFPFVGTVPITEKEKQYEQATQAFLSAVLRTESGATITGDELDQARRTYIASHFDPPEVRRQKAQARRRAIEGVEGVAGRAAGPSYSADNPFASR